jgi:hypothetical protein
VWRPLPLARDARWTQPRGWVLSLSLSLFWCAHRPGGGVRRRPGGGVGGPGDGGGSGGGGGGPC